VVAIRKDLGVNRAMRIPLLAGLILILITLSMPAAQLSREQLQVAVSSNDVVWNEPGCTSADSMPLGNGDIGLNVWTEQNGDVVFYIGKTDAWSENPKGTSGLAKVGKVRLSSSPALFNGTNGFSQALRLYDGQIIINGVNGELRLWVDANSPVIHAAVKSSNPCVLTVSLDPYRVASSSVVTNAATNNLSQFQQPNLEELKPDYHAEGLKDRLAWCHFNGTTNGLGKPTAPEVVNWGFGALIQGRDMTASGTGTLTSPSAISHEVAVTVASGKAGSDREWVEQVLQASTAPFPKSDEEQWQAHADWWHAFWDRSYVFVDGTPEAEKVTQGYALQRFKTACAGRGAYPIKFNGSLFVIDWPSVSFGKDKVTGVETIRPVTADYRAWGGQYWFQNTRAMYWPRLKAGDYDMMQPLFRMYLGEIRNNEATVKQLYNHEGSYVAETSPHWGALPNLVGKTNGAYTDFYFTPVLELSTMMLDYYDHTQDKAFVRETLLPFANLGLTFFTNHFPRDKEGKLLLSPDNSIEMYWMVANPLPDITGLHYVLSRLKQLPGDLTTPEMLKSWSDLEKILPPLPVADKDGKKIIYPYDPLLNTSVKAHNFENPELYAVYPFRLYGLPELGKADLQVARDTYAARIQKGLHCWGQDPMDCAYLGLTDEAKKLVVHDLTNQDKRQKFFAFWDKGHDYAPDEDIGGNGEQTLQLMLMQTEGKRILLLPAWPKEWSCTFKLHAPLKTTISGTVADGKITSLVVDPEERRKDVMIAGGQTLP
jgi:alpha-L-fucosidase 2